jgi:ketosteroid isomerase-like protein
LKASNQLLEERMPATEEDVVRLRAAYDAMRSGDVIPLAELMDENIRWIGSQSLGDPPPECNGRTEASDMLEHAIDRMPARDIESVAIAGDRILSVARWHEGQGPPGVDRVYNLFTMRDGRIVKMEDFFDRAAAERAFSGTDVQS